jgi:hypothetical protein
MKLLSVGAARKVLPVSYELIRQGAAAQLDVQSGLQQFQGQPELANINSNA